MWLTVIGFSSAGDRLNCCGPLRCALICTFLAKSGAGTLYGMVIAVSIPFTMVNYAITGRYEANLSHSRGAEKTNQVQHSERVAGRVRLKHFRIQCFNCRPDEVFFADEAPRSFSLVRRLTLSRSLAA